MSKQKTGLNLQTLRRVLTYVKPYRLHVFISILCASVSAAAALLIPIFAGNAIDFMLGADSVNLAGVMYYAVLILIALNLSRKYVKKMFSDSVKKTLKGGAKA